MTKDHQVINFGTYDCYPCIFRYLFITQFLTWSDVVVFNAIEFY